MSYTVTEVIGIIESNI